MRKLYWPCQGRLSQAWMMNPADYARWGFPGHNGIDIEGMEGAPIHALADGLVAYTGDDEGYGLYVRVWHPEYGMHSFYAHLSRVLVLAEESVAAKQAIGLLGSTGNSTGPHLHLEIRLGNGLHSYDTTMNGMTKGRVDPSTVLQCSDRWLQDQEQT